MFPKSIIFYVIGKTVETFHLALQLIRERGTQRNLYYFIFIIAKPSLTTFENDYCSQKESGHA